MSGQPQGFVHLREMLDGCLQEYHKFDDRKVKVSGTKLRKLLLTLRNTIQDERKRILADQKAIVSKPRVKKVVEEPEEVVEEPEEVVEEPPVKPVRTRKPKK